MYGTCTFIYSLNYLLNPLNANLSEYTVAKHLKHCLLDLDKQYLSCLTRRLLNCGKPNSCGRADGFFTFILRLFITG